MTSYNARWSQFAKNPFNHVVPYVTGMCHKILEITIVIIVGILWSLKPYPAQKFGRNSAQNVPF